MNIDVDGRLLARPLDQSLSVDGGHSVVRVERGERYSLFSTVCLDGAGTVPSLVVNIVFH